jgi:hypothetical protein
LVLGDLGELERATALREELLLRSLAGQVVDYPAVARELAQLARQLARTVEHERTAVCINECLRIRRACLGDEDPLTLASMRDSLEASMLTDDWSAVATLAREYHDAHVLALGEGDDNTTKCARLIANGYEQAGDMEQADVWRALLK